jgi:hypothetical protein
MSMTQTLVMTARPVNALLAGEVCSTIRFLEQG